MVGTHHLPQFPHLGLFTLSHISGLAGARISLNGRRFKLRPHVRNILKSANILGITSYAQSTSIHMVLSGFGVTLNFPDNCFWAIHFNRPLDRRPNGTTPAKKS